MMRWLFCVAAALDPRVSVVVSEKGDALAESAPNLQVDAAGSGESLADVARPLVRGWVEILGGVARGPLVEDPMIRATASAMGCAFLMLLLLAGWCHTSAGKPLPPGKRTLSELVGLGIFRLYAGLLMCTWVPFLLAEEGDKLAPDHIAIFMGGGKLILGVAMILCPVFGLLNDRTKHPWGRRRAWFLLGVLLLLLGISTCAFASYFKRASLYFVGVLIWTLGESIAESSTEALIPDTCMMEDYMRAASVRSVMFTIGGLVGYSLIAAAVMSNRFSPSYIYIYYFVTLVVTVPWNVYFASPTEAELEGEPPVQDDGQSLWTTCYTDTFNASPYFRIISIVYFIQAAATTPVMFYRVIIHDLVGIHDDHQLDLHMALLSITCLVMMACSSAMMSRVSDHQRATSWIALFIVVYSVSEMVTPMTYAVSGQPTGRLTYLYCVAAIKGLAFGGIYSTMQPIAWGAIPAAWKEGSGSVARATAWLSVCRSIGMGAGNFLVGVVLEMCKALVPGGPHYTISGWVLVHLFSGVCGMVSLVLLNQSVKLKGGVVVT